MKRGRVFTHAVLWLLVVVMVLPPWAFAQDTGGAPPAVFSNEQLEQILAPIALYPDDLIAQILMASTYPIEIVQADRWVKQNKDLKGDALTNALEKQDWDPSVKSLVNFSQVLSMMSEKLDWTQKLGDAFLGQEKEVMDTVQVLRRRAKDAGNLNTTPEQKVVVEKETIIIQPANPEVVYVPTYNPTVVYGAWPYPAYPPYYYYPPGYVPGAALFSFGVGLALGAAWGYAWGGCNWHGGDVNVNYNRNTNINNKIDRGRYAQQLPSRGQGKWQHNPDHRKGAAYRDSKTARQFGQSSSRPTASTREARGFGESRGAGAQTRDLGGARGAGQAGGRQSAFSGAGNGGFERSASQRGQASRSGSFGGGGSRGGGGFSGGSRGGGGGGRR
ncbi:MAG TPA: DUF3300 domain-containing protein [Thermodesulfovibrionales bacterium]|nr:DUF3300 domain-containing protein [Thermodesulfovibrionales bacterium]